jgi:hypothetical protein
MRKGEEGERMMRLNDTGKKSTHHESLTSTEWGKVTV